MDRFGAVVFPLRSPLISSKMYPFFILATWIVAMTYFSPYLFLFKLVEHPGKRACELPWNEAFGESSYLAGYYVALYVIFLYVPIALLVILYSIIVIKFKTQIFPGEQSDNGEQQLAKRNRNVLKMAIAIVVGRLVPCWLPRSIVRLFYYFRSFSSCAINPCICVTFCRNYRQGLQRLFKCSNVVQE